MSIIEQPVLIAATAADNAVGIGIMLVMFAVLLTGMAMHSLRRGVKGFGMNVLRPREHRSLHSRHQGRAPCVEH